jgi:hypothetical protein
MTETRLLNYAFVEYVLRIASAVLAFGVSWMIVNRLEQLPIVVQRLLSSKLHLGNPIKLPAIVIISVSYLVMFTLCVDIVMGQATIPRTCAYVLMMLGIAYAVHAIVLEIKKYPYLLESFAGSDTPPI